MQQYLDVGQERGLPGPCHLGPQPLADFYDLHCPNIITFTVPAIGDWTVRCNKMITHLNVNLPEIGVLAGASLSGSMTENLETGVVERATLEMGVSVGVGSSRAGPVAGEVVAKGSVFVTLGLGGKVGGGVTVCVNSGVAVSAPKGSMLNIPVGGAP